KQEIHVKRKKPQNPHLPIQDYRPALQCAVSWLGERYLLAEPVRRLHKPVTYFAESRPWLPGTRH
ncbi:MAG: hypothetical protein K0R53_2835, partial [Burkholderiales bacterium]|nr:hypothetical protein [Burkholderiales bacterium]